MSNNIGYYNQGANINEIPRSMARTIIGFNEASDNVVKNSNNDDLFKLLKYNSPDALTNPANTITIEDKVAIFNQNININETGVIFKRFNDDTIEHKISQLRFFIQELRPENNVLSRVVVGIDILVHNDIAILDKGYNRGDFILGELLKSLNGKENIGLGKLQFDISGGAKLLDFNDKFQGYRMLMGTRSV